MFKLLNNQKIAMKLLIPIVVITIVTFVIINLVIDYQVKALSSNFIVDTVENNTKNFVKEINVMTKSTVEKVTLLTQDKKLAKLFYEAQYNENGERLYKKTPKKLIPIDKQKLIKHLSHLKPMWINFQVN